MKKTHDVLRVCPIYALALAVLLSCTPPVRVPVAPPAAPTGVTAEAASFCRVIVRWTDNSADETGFIIQRSTSDTFAVITEINVPADTEAWSDRDGLSASTTYYYRVLAVNVAGNSDPEAAAGGTDTGAIPAPVPSGSRVAGHAVIDWIRDGQMAAADINTAKASLHIGYGHTSHGSQLADGMNGLVAFANGTGCGGAYTATPGLFTWNRGGTGGALDLREGDGYGSGDLDHDCGYYPNWIEETRAYLDNPANWEVNVIIWSWCGQAAGYSEEYMEEAYLDPMALLEADYPDITFVYMTCHLNGTGLTGTLHVRNDQIRQFCADGDRWLFDFADIESYDPDGAVNYSGLYADDACNYDAGGNGQIDFDPITGELTNGDLNWAQEWQDGHTENTDWYDCGSAHTLPLNANMKAYAAWWLWCRLAGWDGN